MIIDCHGHLASTRVLPEVFFHGWARNVGRKLQLGEDSEGRVQDLLLSGMQDDVCDALASEMTEAGIAKTVLLIIDFGVVFPEAQFDIELVHEMHRPLARKPDRWSVFSGVDPRRGKLGLDLFEKAVRDWGFAGLKVYPPCGYSPSDASLFPFYEVCRAYRVPVLTHVGPTSEALSFAHTTPMDVDEAARRFPDVDFILAHAALRWDADARLLAEYRSNVYLDTSGFQDGLANGEFAAALSAHIRHGLSHKLLFGIDWPIHRLFGTQRRWVESFQDVCTAIRVPAADRERILWGNCAELLAKRGR